MHRSFRLPLATLAACALLAALIHSGGRATPQSLAPATADGASSIDSAGKNASTALLPTELAQAPEADADNQLFPDSYAQEPPEDQDTQETMEKLFAADPSDRSEAALQLAATQTEKSAQKLALALSKDPAAEVREAAAETLVVFDRLPKQAWDALLAGLEDINPKVQAASADTVQTQLFKSDKYGENSETAERILAALKTSLRSSKLTDETREALQDLMEQFAGTDES